MNKIVNALALRSVSPVFIFSYYKPSLLGSEEKACKYNQT